MSIFQCSLAKSQFVRDSCWKCRNRQSSGAGQYSDPDPGPGEMSVLYSTTATRGTIWWLRSLLSKKLKDYS